MFFYINELLALFNFFILRYRKHSHTIFPLCWQRHTFWVELNLSPDLQRYSKASVEWLLCLPTSWCFYSTVWLLPKEDWLLVLVKTAQGMFQFPKEKKRGKNEFLNSHIYCLYLWQFLFWFILVGEYVLHLTIWTWLLILHCAAISLLVYPGWWVCVTPHNMDLIVDPSLCCNFSILQLICLSPDYFLWYIQIHPCFWKRKPFSPLRPSKTKNVILV